LAISKRMAGILGGDIVVSSSPGQGSTFSLSIATGNLDSVITQETSKAVITSGPVSNVQHALTCRILLAEDGPDNQRLIGFLLRKAGAKVEVAENGQIALDLALAARQAGSPFDIILMDMQMPVMDGYEATQNLRRTGYRGPIIALTAHAMTEDRQKCIDAGCDGYMTKPIDPKKLIGEIETWVAAAAMAPEPSKTVGKAKAPQKLTCRILVAEDSPDIQFLIESLLCDAGANVELADNGQIALDLALAAQQAGSPFDIICMDMQMPVMDGYEATQRLRRAAYKGPIIALTAHAMAGDREKCIEAGCDDYITKPIDPEKLVEALGAWAAKEASPV